MACCSREYLEHLATRGLGCDQPREIIEALLFHGPIPITPVPRWWPSRPLQSANLQTPGSGVNQYFNQASTRLLRKSGERLDNHCVRCVAWIELGSRAMQPGLYVTARLTRLLLVDENEERIDPLTLKGICSCYR
jgi:hypothetical protein